MKQEEIKIRVNSKLKSDFQDICENEQITMSNKISNFIINEVRIKKVQQNTNPVMVKRLIKFGVMSTDGRLYTSNELTKTRLDIDGFEYTEFDRLNSKPVYGQFTYGDSEITHKYNATHSVSNFKIEGDWLIGDVTILNQSIIPILDNLVFRSRSFGYIDTNGMVKELDIIAFDAILKSDDTFKDHIDGN